MEELGWTYGQPNICLSLFGFLHSVWWFLGPSMLLQMALFQNAIFYMALCFFIWHFIWHYLYGINALLELRNTPLCRCTTSLSSPLSVEGYFHIPFCCCSVTQSCPTLRPPGRQHARLPCPSPSSGALSNSCPLSHWCHPTISSSVVTSSCLQSFPASGSFLVSQIFASGGRSIGASASALVLPMNIQDWFPLGLTGLISLHSKGLSRVFSSTTVQKHQFFGTQPSLMVQLSYPYMTTGKSIVLARWQSSRPLSAKYCLCFLICSLDWS